MEWTWTRHALQSQQHPMHMHQPAVRLGPFHVHCQHPRGPNWSFQTVLSHPLRSSGGSRRICRRFTHTFQGMHLLAWSFLHIVCGRQKIYWTGRLFPGLLHHGLCVVISPLPSPIHRRHTCPQRFQTLWIYLSFPHVGYLMKYHGLEGSGIMRCAELWLGMYPGSPYKLLMAPDVPTRTRFTNITLQRPPLYF